ncbi:hypothetical protein L218DRAFT_948811 [Marasmius fiardii PR-910]|nr:hypothetical protein L218DRAFT_948811 [Marasmius fiardii PR-910]
MHYTRFSLPSLLEYGLNVCRNESAINNGCHADNGLTQILRYSTSLIHGSEKKNNEVKRWWWLKMNLYAVSQWERDQAEVRLWGQTLFGRHSCLAPVPKMGPELKPAQASGI